MVLDPLMFIREQVSGPNDYSTPFGYKVHERNNRFFLTFDAVLQSFGIKNRNQRCYDAQNIMERIENDPYIQTMLKQNSWIGELNHPYTKLAGEELSSERLANPDPDRSSHFVRAPRLNGNLLEAHIQTDSSNEYGMNFAIKIVDGKIIPAFSARAIGTLKNLNGKPTVIVKKLICYDAVLYPSHAEAVGKITQHLNESINSIENYTCSRVIPTKELAEFVVKNSDESKFLMESFSLTDDDIIGVTETGNSVVLKENASVIVQPIKDSTIRNRTRSLLKDWM